jgi:hypothetical protein
MLPLCDLQLPTPNGIKVADSSRPVSTISCANTAAAADSPIKTSKLFFIAATIGKVFNLTMLA